MVALTAATGIVFSSIRICSNILYVTRSYSHNSHRYRSFRIITVFNYTCCTVFNVVGFVVFVSVLTHEEFITVSVCVVCNNFQILITVFTFMITGKTMTCDSTAFYNNNTVAVSSIFYSSTIFY